jgi:hypothetical protein
MNRKMGHTFSNQVTVHNDITQLSLGHPSTVNLHKKKKNPIKLFIQNLVPKETPELSAIRQWLIIKP